MSIPIEEILQRLPNDRRERIERKAETSIREYESLMSFRKDIGLTQIDVADTLGTNQVSISKLENREDMRLSTLKRYVEALGCTLEITIREPKGENARIVSLL